MNNLIFIKMTQQPFFKNICIFLVLLSITFTDLYAQEKTKILTLNEAIEIAKRQSPDALNAMHRYRSSYWQYRNFKAELKPSLTLDAVLPSINKGIEKGYEDEYINLNNSSYSGGLSLSKNIGLTGGVLALKTQILRFDNYRIDSSYYVTSPIVNIEFTQPLFGYNPYRWSRKIEPIKYNEAERRYIEELEQVSINTTNAFFRLLDAQIRLKIQKINLANNDTLFQIARGRYNIGTIAENELLQIELSLLNSRSAVKEANLEVEMRTFDLISYLRIPENEVLELISPEAPPVEDVNSDLAIGQARLNRSDALSFDRRLLEAESSVNKARIENRFNATLFAEYGLNQRAHYFDDVYRNPSEVQNLQVGIRVPILDWGLGKGRLKLAESNMEIERTSVEQDIKDFNQEVFIKVMQFNMQPSQYAIAAKSDTVALKRYEVTKQRYLIGKIGITDLNIAQTEKDNAQQGYIAALSTFWRSYFELRKLTLYDFEAGRTITFNFNDIPDVE
ncbi:MAG: TolC family protein [Omnitrophica WOR_2 bacterium]|jgi:outer membrane protein TolC